MDAASFAVGSRTSPKSKRAAFPEEVAISTASKLSELLRVVAHDRLRHRLVQNYSADSCCSALSLQPDGTVMTDGVLLLLVSQGDNRRGEGGNESFLVRFFQ